MQYGRETLTSLQMCELALLVRFSVVGGTRAWTGRRMPEPGFQKWASGRPAPLGYAKRAPQIFKDPAGNLRFRAGIGLKARPNLAQNVWNGARKPAPNDSERFCADFGVFRRRSETFKL